MSDTLILECAFGCLILIELYPKSSFLYYLCAKLLAIFERFGLLSNVSLKNLALQLSNFRQSNYYFSFFFQIRRVKYRQFQCFKFQTQHSPQLNLSFWRAYFWWLIWCCYKHFCSYIGCFHFLNPFQFLDLSLKLKMIFYFKIKFILISCWKIQFY